MSLIFASAPNEAPKLIQDYLNKVLSFSDTRKRVLPHISMEEIHLSPSFQVYTVTLKDLSEGKLLSASKQTGWLYLLISNNESPAFLQLGYPNQKNDLKVFNLTKSRFAELISTGIKAAENENRLINGRYEVRILDLPSAYFYGLWFHGDNDLIMPLSDSHKVLAPLNLYNELHVIQEIQKSAKDLLDFHG